MENTENKYNLYIQSSNKKIKVKLDRNLERFFADIITNEYASLAKDDSGEVESENLGIVIKKID